MRSPRLAPVAVFTLASVPAAGGQPQAELAHHFGEIGQGDCTLGECPATMWPRDADGDGVAEPSEGHRFVEESGNCGG